MSAPVLMVLASLLFAGMGVCVKLASAQFNTGEIVFWRGVIGMLFVLSLVRLRGGTLRTTVPLMHLTRAGVGVTALDRKSTRLNSSHSQQSRMPSSA